MIVVISDVHLGHEKCNRESFRRFVSFLRTREIDRVILLGDILDFWRRSADNVVEENNAILSALEDLDAKKYYIIGNHDYSLLGSKDHPFKFGKSLSLKSNGCKFRFVHGYQIEFRSILQFYEGICEVLCTSGDGTGKILNEVWDFYDGELRRILDKNYSECWRNLTKRELGAILNYVMKYPEEESLHREFTEAQVAEYRKCAHMDPEEILVYGHTHYPAVNTNQANAGCWTSNSTNSYLTIGDEKLNLHYWKGGIA